MHKPLVSIIMPAYNVASYISEAIESVIAQSFKNWELIIIDDGSKDATQKIVSQYIPHKQISYFYQENKGVSSARNTAIAKSKGIYIFPLDADDKINSNFLEQAVKVMQEDQEVELVYGNVTYFGTMKEQFVLPEYTYKKLFVQNLIVVSALFKKASFKKTNGYDERLPFFEDWDLWLQLLNSNSKVVKLNKVALYYRKHNTSATSIMNLEANKKYYDIIYTKHQEQYNVFFGSPILLIKQLEKQKKNVQRITNSWLYKLYTKFK